MTTLSTRYVGALLALLLPALFAVWGYTCGGFRSDECADPSALRETGWIEGLERGSEPDGESPPWLIQDVGGSVSTKAPELSELEFRIVRLLAPGLVVMVVGAQQVAMGEQQRSPV